MSSLLLMYSKMPKKLDDMHKAIKAQLMKDNPMMKDEEADNKAWAIAQSQYKKMQGENLKLDEKGRIIVAENVRLILGANITGVGDIINE